MTLFGRIALDDIDRRDPAGHPAADGDHVRGDAGVVDEDMGKLLVQPPAAADQDDQASEDSGKQTPRAGTPRFGVRGNPAEP